MNLISESISRDFSPRLFTGRSAANPKVRFSSQELLDISQQISREYAPSKSTPQSRLVLLAVSPQKLHAYWHVAKRQLTHALKRLEQQQPMILRIYTEAEPLPEESAAQPWPDQATCDTPWLDMLITESTGQQDIFLPEPVDTAPSLRYHATLGETNHQHRFLPLLHSNTTELPKVMPYAESGQNTRPRALTQSIMQGMLPASTVAAGKSSSGRGK